MKISQILLLTTVYLCIGGNVYADTNVHQKSDGFNTFSTQVNEFHNTDHLMKISINDDVNMTFYGDIKAGYVDEMANYSSFGLEKQIFTLEKAILSFNANIYNNFSFHMDLAPIYSSIKYEHNRYLEGLKDQNDGRTFEKVSGIDGTTIYEDWYRNRGNRIYYLGENMPILEAYADWKPLKSLQLRVGRQKDLSGFRDYELPWGDNGKFSPYEFWLSQDLLTGGVLSLSYKGISLSGSLFSGDNPIKASPSYYLNGVGDPNTKTNNTITYEIRADIRPFRFVSKIMDKEYDSHIFTSLHIGRMGSSRNKITQSCLKFNADERNYDCTDSKTIQDIFAIGFKTKVPKVSAILKDDVNLYLFGQYTYYKSGLKGTNQGTASEDSPLIPPRQYKQQGFYIGTELQLFNRVKLWYAFEQFQRADFKTDVYFMKQQDTYNAIYDRKVKQYSNIFGIKYYLTDNIELGFNYHNIKNPYMAVSNIMESKGDNKMEFTINAKF